MLLWGVGDMRIFENSPRKWPNSHSQKSPPPPPYYAFIDYYIVILTNKLPQTAKHQESKYRGLNCRQPNAVFTKQ